MSLGSLLEGDLVSLECEMSICLILKNPFVILTVRERRRSHLSLLPQPCCGSPPSVCSRPSASSAPPLAPPAASAEAAAPPSRREEVVNQRFPSLVSCIHYTLLIQYMQHLLFPSTSCCLFTYHLLYTCTLLISALLATC